MLYRKGKKTPLEALKNTSETKKAIKENLKSKDKIFLDGFSKALDRIDNRKYIDIATNNVGVSVEYQQGYTYKLFFYSFIPSMLWQSKPEISIGRLVNNTFSLSLSPLTYVPISQLGEFYWNFGFIGVIAGMFFIGIIFSIINTSAYRYMKLDLSGFLILIISSYLLVLRFEGGFATQYSQYVRVLILLYFMLQIAKKIGIRRVRSLSHTK